MFMVRMCLSLKVSNISKSAANLWSTYNKQFYQKFDMQFTGFLIQGISGQMTPGEKTL